MTVILKCKIAISWYKQARKQTPFNTHFCMTMIQCNCSSKRNYFGKMTQYPTLNRSTVEIWHQYMPYFTAFRVHAEKCYFRKFSRKNNLLSILFEVILTSTYTNKIRWKASFMTKFRYCILTTKNLMSATYRR